MIVLCTTEIISSGILCHAFSVLLPTISSQTGWSQAVITAGFSASQIVAGLVGVPVGKLLDRHGARAVMTTGSVVAVPALTALTLVAGLASTVSAPLTAVLNPHLNWRGTYLVPAGILAVTTIPLHLFGLRSP